MGKEHIDCPLIAFPVNVCGKISQSCSHMNFSPVGCLSLGIEQWAKKRLKNNEKSTFISILL